MVPRPSPVLLIILCLVASAASASEALRGDWPGFAGPTGDYSAPYDGPLIDDLAQARLVWSSEERLLGKGKFTSAWRGAGKNHETPLGGSNSGPIVYAGKVIVSTFRPSGAVVDEAIVAKGRQKHGDGFRSDLYRVVADDVIVAIDAASGRTAWKQEFPEEGINLMMGKRGGWGVTPVGWEGAIFAMTTVGRVLALDAESGAIRWSADNGSLASRQAKRQELLAVKRMAGNDDHLSLTAHLAVIGEVLLTADASGRGLLALDPKNGQRLWERNDIGNSAYRLKARDGEYIVAGNRSGELRLLEPRTGEERWVVRGLGALKYKLTVSGDHAFVVGKRPEAEGIDENWGPWLCYRLSPEQAELIWTSDMLTNFGGDGGPQHVLTTRAGRVYLGQGGSMNHPENIRGKWTYVVDIASGQVLQKAELTSAVALMWGDRLVVRTESDGDAPYNWYSSENLEQLGTPNWLPRQFTAGYTVPLLPCFVDGRLFIRMDAEGGCVRCYDLRKAAQ